MAERPRKKPSKRRASKTSADAKMLESAGYKVLGPIKKGTFKNWTRISLAGQESYVSKLLMKESPAVRFVLRPDPQSGGWGIFTIDFGPPKILNVIELGGYSGAEAAWEDLETGMRKLAPQGGDNIVVPMTQKGANVLRTYMLGPEAIAANPALSALKQSLLSC